MRAPWIAVAASLAVACTPAGAPLQAFVAAARRADVPVNLGPRMAIGACDGAEAPRGRPGRRLPTVAPGAFEAYRASGGEAPRRAIVRASLVFSFMANATILPVVQGEVVPARLPHGGGCDAPPPRPAGAR